MASKADQLLLAYEGVINEPWATSLSGAEKVWFLVFDPAEMRKIDLRIDDFETATKKAGKKWVTISLKRCFPDWMAAHDYKDEYFADPESLVDQLEGEFKYRAIDFLKNAIDNSGADEQTIVAIRDISALFGFARVSDVLNGCTNNIKGRMLIFFPGEHDKNQYRLLDARDGWSYLARPIIA